METLISLLIAGAITLLFVWRYMRKLARAAQHAASGGSGDKPAGNNPRPVINASVCIGCGSCVEACPEAGALALVEGKAILANPARCTTHARCVEVCPTQAITLSVAGILQTLRVPSMNDEHETNVPGVFVAGELGGIGLIKISINEGRLVIDRVAERIRGKGAMAVDSGVYEVAIVGSGPAGLSATLAAHQHGLRYITLEQGEIASTIRNFPRRKLVFAEPLEMPLFGDLYMADTSKESLLKAWDRIIAETGVKIVTNARVETVSRDNGCFAIRTVKGEFFAANVVLAIGRRGSPRRLRVPGEDLDKVAYTLLDAGEYRAKDILVAGGGDSAIECALALSKRNRVALSYRGGSFERLKQRNLSLLSKAETEGRIRIIRQSTVLEIRPASVLLEQAGSKLEIANDYVFVMIGGQSPDELLKKIGIEIVEKTISSVPAAQVPA